MKYLNLTNASPTQRGMKLAIRKDQVITVHSNLTTREDGTIEQVTYIFGPPHGTWEVQETFENVWKQLLDNDWDHYIAAQKIAAQKVRELEISAPGDLV